MSKLIEQIKAMDTKSEEFFEIYEAVNEKWFTVEDPDEYQKSCQYLNLILNRGEEWMVELMVKLGHELFNIVDQGVPATAGSFQVKDKDVHFSFSTGKSALGNLEKMLRNTVVMKAKEQGVDIMGKRDE